METSKVEDPSKSKEVTQPESS